MTLRNLLTAFWIFLAAGAGIGLFILKYEVQALEEELDSLESDITADREAVHVLKAEWSHLTDPTRLRRLAAEHTDLNPISPRQVISFDQLDRLLAPGSPEEALPVPRRKPAAADGAAAFRPVTPLVTASDLIYGGRMP